MNHNQESIIDAQASVIEKLENTINRLKDRIKSLENKSEFVSVKFHNLSPKMVESVNLLLKTIQDIFHGMKAKEVK